MAWAREQAEASGLTFRRIESLNAHEDLIGALARIAARTVHVGWPALHRA